MQFLNPGLWLALAPLVAAPVIIHLLNKRFPQRFLFPTVEHLARSAAERSRIHRWRHRILAVVRTLLLLLLLLAFLQPVLRRFDAAGAGPQKRRVLLLIDHSLSMEYQEAGVTARRRAVIEAEKILDTLGAEDEVNVVAVGAAPTACFVGFTANLPEARRFLRALPAAATRADYSAANLAVARLLTKGTAPGEVYYLSDFQRRNWAQVDFQPLAGRARLFFVDVGAAAPANRGILGVALGQARALAGDQMPIEVTVGNFSAEPFSGNVTVGVDKRQRVEQPVVVAPWSSARVTVPVSAGSPGLHLCDISLPPDNLAADDSWVIVLPVAEKEEILTVSAQSDPARPPVRFLHAALNPFPGQAGSLLPRHVEAGALDPAALAGASKVFLTGCGPIEPAACEALAAFLFRGGGVVWFLDHEADADNLRRLQSALGSTRLPLEAGPLRQSANVGAGARQIASGEFDSPLLRLFRGTLRQDLGLLEIHDFHAASATGSGHVLPRFDDETPAMAAVEHGLGTLVLMNFSVNELSSNLARQRIFPAWVQEIVKRLDTTEPPPPAFTVGGTVQGEVWRADLRQQPLTSPSGRVLDVHQEPQGARALISFPAEELGFYTLTDGRIKNAYAVNPDPEESDLRVVDRAHLPTQLAAGQEAGFLGSQTDYEELARGRPIAHWFLLAAAAVLLLELCLQLWFRRLAHEPVRRPRPRSARAGAAGRLAGAAARCGEHLGLLAHLRPAHDRAPRFPAPAPARAHGRRAGCCFCNRRGSWSIRARPRRRSPSSRSIHHGACARSTWAAGPVSTLPGPCSGMPVSPRGRARPPPKTRACCASTPTPRPSPARSKPSTPTVPPPVSISRCRPCLARSGRGRGPTPCFCSPTATTSSW